jgi:hypothetical protein
MHIAVGVLVALTIVAGCTEPARPQSRSPWIPFSAGIGEVGAYDSSTLRYRGDTARLWVQVRDTLPFRRSMDSLRLYHVDVHCPSRHGRLIDSLKIQFGGRVGTGFTSGVRDWRPFTDPVLRRAPFYSVCAALLQRQASVRVTDRRLEVVFPAIPLSKVGCGEIPAYIRPPVRQYSWSIQNQFSDSRVNNAHLMWINIGFQLPASTPLTRARIDSAFAAQRPTVHEGRGEPPFNIAEFRPARTVVWWDSTGVRVVIDDTVAVREFLRPGRDSVYLSWCQRDQPVSVTWRRIDRGLRR